MKRILLVVAYDGSAYHGWQVQPNGNTIEEELNNKLSALLKEDIKVSGASRTDTGVHALCNLAVFDTDTRIPADKISYALNQRLPEDIRIRRSVEVPSDFHPRYAETVKTYEYRILNSRMPIPTRRLYTHFCYYRLDVKKMRDAGKLLEGEHDFAGFCSVGTQAASTVRKIFSLNVTEEEVGGIHEIAIRVSGNGFLYNMVRIIAGTLIDVGRGALDIQDVVKALEIPSREYAGPTAPARGLTLLDYKFVSEEYANLLLL